MAATLDVLIKGTATSAVNAFKQTSDAAKTATGSAEKTGSSLGKIAAGVATGMAVAKVVEFGKSTIKAAEESELAHNRLVAVFKGVGDASGAAAAGAEKYATKLSNATGIDDELIMGGQAILATFHSVSGQVGRTAGIFDRATAAGADLAAAGFGDINSNAVQLGKALEDPTKGMTALAKSGVTFTEAQKEQIKQMQKSGDLLGAQKVVLGGVESQVKGTAEATGTAGQKMNVAWGNAQESIGATLLPAIEMISTKMTGLFSFISANASWLVPIVGAVVSIAGALFVFAKAAEMVKVAIGGVKLAWTLLNAVFAASPIGLIVIAVIAVIAILVLLYLKVDWFRAAVDAALRVVVGIFKSTWSAITAGFNTVIAFIKRWSDLFLLILLGPFYIVFKLIKAAITGGWSGVMAQINGWLGMIGRAVGGIANVIAGPFRAAWGLIQTYLLSPLAGAFRGVAGAIAGALSGVTNAITAPFTAAWNFISSRIIAPLKGAWNGIANAINGFSITTPEVKILNKVIVPAFHWSVPFHVPTLAAGGLMTSSGLVYAHAGEVISPAPARARGDGPLVAIANAHFSEKIDVATFGRRLAWEMETAGV